jgi:RNA ligase (TIGR02306 family)
MSSNSSRTAPIVEINLEKHPNADLLSLCKINDWQCVLNTEQWKGKTRAFWIEPETLVKTNKEEFSFLKREGRDKERIKAKKIRGEWSVGLLIPVPDNFTGNDGWDYLELEHYEPPEEIEGMKLGYTTPPPAHWANLPKYDLENFRGYNYLFQDGELVYIVEKLNGANQSVVYSDGEYHVKSRNFWKKEEGCDFWKALRNNEPLMKYLRDNPNTLVQGEMIGKVKGYTYGLNGKVEFRAFDIRKPDYSYVDPQDFHKICEDNDLIIPRVFSYKEPYSKELVLQHTDGEQFNNSKGIREGVVVSPAIYRYCDKLNGRLKLKCVSNSYLEKS